MRDVALVPERHVFEPGLSVGADHASQAADLLRRDGVAFVRHGGRPLLVGREVLLHLAHFGALGIAGVRPASGACLNSMAPFFRTSPRRASPLSSSAEASLTCSAGAVSTTSFEVSP